MSDWITLTLAVNGYRKRIRRSAVLSYGRMPNDGPSFIDLAGKTIEVRESEAQLCALIEDPELLK